MSKPYETGLVCGSNGILNINRSNYLGSLMNIQLQIQYSIFREKDNKSITSIHVHVSFITP